MRERELQILYGSCCCPAGTIVGIPSALRVKWGRALAQMGTGEPQRNTCSARAYYELGWKAHWNGDFSIGSVHGRTSFSAFVSHS